MNELDAKTRMLVVLHDIEGMSYKEITELLGCSLRVLKTKLACARKILRRKASKYFRET